MIVLLCFMSRDISPRVRHSIAFGNMLWQTKKQDSLIWMPLIWFRGHPLSTSGRQGGGGLPISDKVGQGERGGLSKSGRRKLESGRVIATYSISMLSLINFHDSVKSII